MGDSGQLLSARKIHFLSVVFGQHLVETTSVVATQHKYSVETTSIYINRRKIMIAQLLERLAEMFPKQDYQTRLERYLQSKNIQNEGDINYWITRYNREGHGV
jgi:hypothetical protein